MKWSWREPAENGRMVTLDVNYWTGSKRLAVDGQVIPTKNKQLGWSHEFALGDQRAVVSVKLRYLVAPEAELQIDGARLIPVEWPRPLPRWTWLFVLANVAILVASRGGAIPGAIAGIGAVAAVGAARSNLSLTTRLALCTLATAAAWGALAVLLHVVT